MIVFPFFFSFSFIIISVDEVTYVLRTFVEIINRLIEALYYHQLWWGEGGECNTTARIDVYPPTPTI